MESKNWYKECGDSIRAEFGADAELFIDLLAATSPRKQVSANWRLAMRIYHVWQNREVPVFGMLPPRSYDNLMRGTLPAHRPNIIKALQRKSLSGNKVTAFAANLKGNLQEVTLDVWMCRHYGYPQILSDKKYAELAAIVRTEAATAGLQPAEYQAVIWHETIRAYGKKPRSYLGVRDRNQLFFEFYLTS
uniref:Uncharacterized protein n=1 Tax=viral metagenome TaxID=1070528 RepID=A0A6M3LVZ5_9ZZZZ